MATTKEKMMQAKEMIDAKDYAGARKLLATVDHPKAREWESKLPAAPKSSSRMWLYQTIVVLVIGAVVIGVILFQQNAKDEEYAVISARITLICADPINDYDTCIAWRRRVLASGENIDQVKACNNLYSDLDNAFRDCLASEGVFPAGIR